MLIIIYVNYYELVAPIIYISVAQFAIPNYSLFALLVFILVLIDSLFVSSYDFRERPSDLPRFKVPFLTNSFVLWDGILKYGKVLLLIKPNAKKRLVKRH